jgi:Zn-dependent protease/CBS domain-containing protein
MGIPIGVDYSWFLIFALLTWMLAGSYYPAEFKTWPPLLYWVMGAVTALMLFASVLLHELGHSVVALRYKVPVRSVTLFLFGGVTQSGAEPPSAVAEFFIAIAGPIVSIALALVFLVMKPLVAGSEPLWGLVKYLTFINVALALFNLIPGYPLDGGRVFRAIVWAITRNMRRAPRMAANVGRFFGFLLIFVGVFRMLNGDVLNGLWIAFIGWFLDHAATLQVQHGLVQDLLAGHKVSHAMISHCATVPADVTLQQLVDDYILGHGLRCFLVNRGAKTVGLVTLHRIREVPRPTWTTVTAAKVMLPLEQLKRTSPDTELWTALQQMDRDGVNQLPVVTDSQVVGLLSREDVITFLRTLQELGTEQKPP